MPKAVVSQVPDETQEGLARACKILMADIHSRFPEGDDRRYSEHPHPTALIESLAACFELIEQPWDIRPKNRTEIAWREGYMQCMRDFVDSIADELGVVVWFDE